MRNYRKAWDRKILVHFLCISICVSSIFKNGFATAGATDRFDQVGGASHPYESFAGPPGGGGGGGWGWGGGGGGGGTQGSYYHYHVPLVGQQPQGWGWQPEGHKSGHSILLWALALLLGLLLLGALLLPLFLIPLGLSLLALLMGGMMMMAGMPMMMMMMMMMMPQPNAASRSELVGRAIDTMVHVVKGDTDAAFATVLSTMEMDNYCPEKAICSLATTLSTSLPLDLDSFNAQLLKEKFGVQKMTFFAPLISQVKSKQGQKVLRRFEKAFWTGLTTKDCIKMENRCRNLHQLRIRTQNKNGHQNPNFNTSSNGNGTDTGADGSWANDSSKNRGKRTWTGAKDPLEGREGPSTQENPQKVGETENKDGNKGGSFFRQLVTPTFSTPTIRM